MYSDVVWFVLVISMANLGLTFWIGSKILKLEKSSDSENNSNLALIEQSLKRLSHLIETQEQSYQPNKTIEPSVSRDDDQSETTKERRAIYLLRRGENPRVISRKLGISRSEMDLLTASERLGSGHKANIESA
jgi:hypothetical protein